MPRKKELILTPRNEWVKAYRALTGVSELLAGQLYDFLLKLPESEQRARFSELLHKAMIGRLNEIEKVEKSPDISSQKIVFTVAKSVHQSVSPSHWIGINTNSDGKP